MTLSDAPTPPQTDDPAEIARWLFDLARAGEAATIVAYVRAGAPIDMQDAAGNTMLMLAAYHGHHEAVAELAAAGADVDRANDRGQTPLAGAVFKGYGDVVRVLAAAGADASLGSPNALDTARYFGRDELVSLLERGEGEDASA